MALAWKAGWVNSPQGFESPILRANAEPTSGGGVMPPPLGVPTPCNLSRGGVSERPKERASKARVGATSPWVQIPPPPPSSKGYLVRGAPYSIRRTPGMWEVGLEGQTGDTATKHQQPH